MSQFGESEQLEVSNFYCNFEQKFHFSKYTIPQE